MSFLGPEAGHIIIAFPSVPLGAFLLTTETKLLVFIATLGTGTGEKVVSQVTLGPANPDPSYGPQYPQYSACKYTTLLCTTSSSAPHPCRANSSGKLGIHRLTHRSRETNRARARKGSTYVLWLTEHL